MGIGGGIFLIVVGGILAFGVQGDFRPLDLNAIGWVCIGAGVLAIVLTLVLNQQRANTTHTEYVEHHEVDEGPAPSRGDDDYRHP